MLGVLLVSFCTPCVCRFPHRPEEGARSPKTRTTPSSQIGAGNWAFARESSSLNHRAISVAPSAPFCIQPMTTHPGVAPHPETGPPISITNQRKCPMENTHTLWWKHFLDWVSLSSPDSSLCRANEEAISRITMRCPCYTVARVTLDGDWVLSPELSQELSFFLRYSPCLLPGGPRRETQWLRK